MILNLYGEICGTCLNSLPQHCNNFKIDIFIINNSIRDNDKLGEGYKPSPTYSNYSLTEIVRGFKTFSSKQTNQTISSGNKFKWQRSFHDHIIRNDKSLNNTREYIRSNPATWDKDVFDIRNPYFLLL
ncbi:MAG: transposase [Candidatus Omnitrophica bacterium]|nr:transposase [Candidatus Omnitrophota bacterium]